MNDRHVLRWSNPPSSLLPELPPNITRHFISTPLGKLELLYASAPDPSKPRQQAILFQHGGFGYAGVWIPYLTWFAERGYPCYALSLRGHGASWKPGFLRMVWGFGKASFAEDLGFAFTWVQAFESAKRGVFEEKDLVLVGHSAGGGLSQYFLSGGLGRVGGLVIMAGFPSFGGLGVYWNWFKLDLWFVPRYYIRDLWHPRSPLSSTSLVRKAFFSPSFPIEKVQEFEKEMPEYESMLFPLGMMFPFVNIRKVLGNIVGWTGSNRSRLLVLAGEKDKLMGVSLMRRMASRYRNVMYNFWGPDRILPLKIPDGAVVTFEVVEGSGHHIQNDLYWEDGAGKILKFLEQL